MAGAAEINLAVKAAMASKEKMVKLSAYERAAILRQITQLLSSEKTTIARLIVAESGKPLKYAINETERAIETFTIAAEETLRLPKEFLSIDRTKAGKDREGLVKYFPAGIIAGISPFNFPINLVAHKIAPAIAAGCPIILKPASSTPLTALYLAGIIDKTDLPKGALSVLPCDRHTGDLLVTHEDIQILSFTGSPQVGWALKAKAGKKKVILELGGNAGVYVHKDAELAQTVNRCLTGAFAYSGQICIHAQRIYVHRDLYKPFLELLAQRTQTLKYGDPLELDTDVSVMIDEENAIRVENWIKESVQNGAQLVSGGKREGWYVWPTILTGTQLQDKVVNEEAFGPVVIVEPVEDENAGIQAINASKFGLQAGVFTNDFRVVQKTFNRLEVGGVIMNDVPTFRADHMPYGGVKESGLGREGVAYTIKEYLEPRILVYYTES
jgi:glyceraldehyde-3-phosphate dehydrogenase (NADP+)